MLSIRRLAGRSIVEFQMSKAIILYKKTVFSMQHSTQAAPLQPLRSQRLLDQVRERIRLLHFSLRTVQAVLGHAHVSTTVIYTFVLKVDGGAVRSLLDALAAR